MKHAQQNKKKTCWDEDFTYEHSYIAIKIILIYIYVFFLMVRSYSYTIGKTSQKSIIMEWAA